MGTTRTGDPDAINRCAAVCVIRCKNGIAARRWREDTHLKSCKPYPALLTQHIDQAYLKRPFLAHISYLEVHPCVLQTQGHAATQRRGVDECHPKCGTLDV